MKKQLLADSAAKLYADIKDLQGKIGNNSSGLVKRVNDANEGYEKAYNAYQSAQSDSTKTPEQKEDLRKAEESAKTFYENAKADLKEAKDELEKKQTALKAANEAKKAADSKIDTLKAEIAQLKTQEKEYQEIVDEKNIVNAHVEGKKADKESASTWTKNGNNGSTNTATQEQLNRAKHELSQAMKKKNGEDIAFWAQKYIDMYENLAGDQSIKTAIQNLGDNQATYERAKRIIGQQKQS